MTDSGPIANALRALPRTRLATLPTPLERGPELPGPDGRGTARLWVKRDDLTGLGGGGNKARKLEFLVGDARAAGCDALVTVGAGQSNHCRITAAAGAVVGLDVHLVLSGDRPAELTGNQLFSALFGAQMHFTGIDGTEWGALEIAREELVETLRSDGATPASIGIGGSSAVGAAGYALAYAEIVDDCRAAGITPAAIIHTSSSGGTHAGLLAGRAIHRHHGLLAPPVIAIGVAKGVIAHAPDPAALAGELLDLIGLGAVEVSADDVVVDPDWMGPDYAIPTAAGDAAILWAAHRGGWLMDRTYSGKGLSGVLGRSFEPGSDVVFIHTGGVPALFAPGGAPLP